MKIISIIFVILISMTSFAANDKTCKSLPDSASDLITFELRDGNFLNKENWN